MATLKDIANEVGISVSAASLALRDHDTISLKTKLKVWAVQERLGYRLHLRDQRQRSSARSEETPTQSRDIAFLLVDRGFDEPLYAQSFQRLAESAAARNWRTIYITSTLQELHDGKIPALLKDSRLDGILISGVYDKRAHTNLKRAINLPIVMIGPYALGDTPWMACEPDTVQGTRLLLHRLAALGHTRFGLIIRDVQSEFNFTVQQTYLAEIARDTRLTNVGIEYEKKRSNGSLEATERLLKQQPTALILGSAFFAPSVYEAIEAAGLKTPDDISVASFRGGPELFLRPQIAQVGSQIMTEGILKKMEALLEDPDTQPVRVLYPMQFIPGGSIGMPPQ